MNIPSTAWSEWIGRGALAGMMLCGATANAQPPARPVGCGNGPGDSCITNADTYGFYPTHWRRWPSVAKTLEPVPANAGDKAAKKPSAAEKSTDKPDETSPKSPDARPPMDNTLPEQPPQPTTQPRGPGGGVDLPPKPPSLMPEEPLTPPETFPLGERPESPQSEPPRNEPPRSEAPVEPPQPEPPPPPPSPIEPEAPPAMPPGVDLPQPSLDDDLLKVLPKARPPANRDKGKPKTPKTKPPTRPRPTEDPFIDDPISIPGEKPAEPRQGRRQPTGSGEERELGGAGPSHLRWGADESEEARASVPVALFRNEVPNTPPPRPAIELAESQAGQPADRQASNAQRAAVVLRDANGSPSGRANPLRRAAPSKILGVDTGSLDQVQQTGESAAGSSIANPLR